MLGEEVSDALIKLGDDIKKFAKINLGDRRRKRKYPSGRTVTGAISASGKLQASIDSKVKISENSTQINIEAEKYATAVDEGRRAAYIPLAPLIQWIGQKRIKNRDAKGRILGKLDEQQKKSMAIAISKAAKKHPRKGTYFLTDAIEDALKKHEDDLIGAMFKDIESATEFILRNLETKE